MSTGNIQALLRFLSQDAKVPLALAMGKVKELQIAGLATPEKLAKAKPDAINAIFLQEKMAKQILSAAKRVSKKRAAGDDAPSPRKKRKDESFFTPKDVLSPEELEASIVLPTNTVSEEELSRAVLFTNRAPIVLAFAVVLLKYTMPEQPLSSRLSLAQAYVSTTSRSRAVSLGIEKGLSAEEEGFGEGQPSVTIMGKELRVLRRWGYEWQAEADVNNSSTQGTLTTEIQDQADGIKTEEEDLAEKAGSSGEKQPALWALDLEAMKKSTILEPAKSHMQTASTANMPIYTPQSARAYLLKSFDTPPAATEANLGKKKPSAAQKAAEKERNLGMLLQAIELLFQSWLPVITPAELDKRIWSWYVKVRPAVENGVAGWGGKNELKLANILALRRVP